MEPVKLRTKTTAKKSSKTGRPSRTTLCEGCGTAFIPSSYHSSPTRDSFRSSLSEEDVTWTRGILEEEEAELNRYDEELARLSRLADKLGSERRALQERVLERRSLLSAMRKLPVEIWEEILSTAVLSWPRYTSLGTSFPINYSLYVHSNRRYGDTDPHPRVCFTPPLVLSQVSSHWRNIIHSLPCLWSSISVDMYSLICGIRPLLKTYFERSRNCSLKIRLIDTAWNTYDEEGLRDLEHWEDFYGHRYRSAGFEDLVKEMPRCQELLLQDLVPAGSLVRMGDPPMAITFPLLRSLSVYSVSLNGTPRLSSWLWGAIHKAPQLVDFAMTHHFTDIDIVPCQQIQFLTIDLLSARSVRNLLKFPQLESLTISNPFGKSDPSIPSGVVLSSVRTLTMDSHDILNILEFLASLKLPSLISLKVVALAGRDHSRHWPWHLFEEMVQRSSCSLETLVLDLVDPIITSSVHELLKIFHVLPSLVNLTLVVRCHSKGPALRASVSYLLSKLSLSDDETPAKSVLIPNLTTFSLQFHQAGLEIGVSEEFLSFAESRCRQRLAASGLTGKVAPLSDVSFIMHKDSSPLPKEEKVAASFSPVEEAGVLQRLRALTRDGMVCTVDERVPAE